MTFYFILKHYTLHCVQGMCENVNRYIIFNVKTIDKRVNIGIEQAMHAQRESRGITLFFL